MKLILELLHFVEPRNHGATNVGLLSEISSTIDDNENWDLEENDRMKIFSADESVSDNSADTRKKTVDST